MTVGGMSPIIGKPHMKSLTMDQSDHCRVSTNKHKRPRLMSFSLFEGSYVFRERSILSDQGTVDKLIIS
jgi:hypothetical protein